jgi:transposase
LRLGTDAGLWRLLDRLGIRYKRARDYLHSPDPKYAEKLALVEECLQKAHADPVRYVLLYLDEFTYYRQPTLSFDYAKQGTKQPLARRSYRSNAWFRVVATLNAITGQVTYSQRSRIGLVQLSNFYAQIRAAYPLAETIYIVQDNWPIHAHPDVLARLQPQLLPWPPRVPGNWKTTPRASALKDTLPIQLLFLPTYASWTNPIEKLWRWLKQTVLHLHRYADDWITLRQQVATFLNRFGNGSLELLRYTGLLHG